MKIVAIVGSKRHGNTYAMVVAAVKAISDNEDVDLIDLGNLHYSFCDGCLQCDETGMCYQQDDMTMVIEKIKSAEGLIIGSPARWGLLSGELKSFFDRLNPLAAPELLSGKKAVLFTVGQSDRESDEAESVRLACASLQTFCENADIKVIDTVCAFGCLEEHDIQNDSAVLLDCAQAARKLVGKNNV